MDATTMVPKLTKAEHSAVMRHQARLSQERGSPVSYEEAEAHWLAQHAVGWREARQAAILRKQREEILRHKWIESEKAQRDLGAEAVFDWIRRYAEQWRKWYDDEGDSSAT